MANGHPCRIGFWAGLFSLKRKLAGANGHRDLYFTGSSWDLATQRQSDKGLGFETLIEGLAAVGSATHAGQLACPFFLLEAVVIGQLLARPDIGPSKEDQVGLPVQLQYFGVHGRRAAVVLQNQSRQCESNHMALIDGKTSFISRSLILSSAGVSHGL